MDNPFEFGKPVHGESFVGREYELRQLHTVVAKGTSALITNEPRSGKTSLLIQLQERLAEHTTPFRIQYLDAHFLSGQTSADFWNTVLSPFADFPPIKEALRTARREAFGTFLLERVFLQLDSNGQRLVLLLDEFDQILDEPALHTAEFYGSLRSLATRYNSLVLILAARQSVAQLNERTQLYSRMGSPYFNFVQEVTLAPFSPDETVMLLKRAGDRFNEHDHRFLFQLSGGHPYFLQVGAYFLWEAFAAGLHNSVERYAWTSEQTFTQTHSVLSDIWRAWSPYQQMAFTLATLDTLPRLLPNHAFDLDQLLLDAPVLAPEQRELRQRGFLSEDTSLRGGYTPRGDLMIWFLAEELTRLLRPSNVDVARWLTEQQWDGMLKKGQKEAIGNVLLRLKPILEHGILSLIKAFVEGFTQGTGR